MADEMYGLTYKFECSVSRDKCLTQSVNSHTAGRYKNSLKTTQIAIYSGYIF